MDAHLSPHEARVVGVLIEKAFTTPDQYPLTLNATTNACNQKSCRNPVLDLTEAEVMITLQGLRMKQVAGGTIPVGSRVERWHHSAKEHYSLSEPSLAVLAELLLRGPQSASALRTHANRMRSIATPEDLDNALADLLSNNMAVLVPAGHGSRVTLYKQTLAPTTELNPTTPANHPRPTAGSSAPQPAPAPTSTHSPLEERVARLEQQLKTLADKLGEPLE
ncbi:MAG: hypothetical protein ACI87O_000983 [Planctomycetota bacterium]|jgi:uncharacterized protein YceH (UPF0502 family)